MTPGWYVLRSRPNKEEFFWGQLIAHHIEVYYPCIRAKAANLHAHKDKPYLPGHLFIHVDLQENPPSFLDGLPGSRGLVTMAAQPVPVPEALIASIRRRVDQINGTGNEKSSGLMAGEAFVMQERLLTGYETIFDGCISGYERVQRLLSLLHGKLLPGKLPDLERI